MTALYTYDDPRITYDELCFYYDGGYDLVCIKEHAVKRIYGRSAAGKKRKEENEEVFNLFIRISLSEVNGKEIDDPLSEKYFRFTDEPELVKINITDLNVSIDMTQPMFGTDYIGITKNTPERVEAVLDKVEVQEPKNIVVVEVPGDKENQKVDISVSLIDVKE